MLMSEGAAYGELCYVVSWGSTLAWTRPPTPLTLPVTTGTWTWPPGPEATRLKEDSSEEAAGSAAISTNVALALGEPVSFALLANDPSTLEAVTKLQTIAEEHSIRLVAVAMQDFLSAK